ncbi:TetR/AcrR family transcriptional regulator [Acetanaerobacterium sp. MSJ-12]|uniref:TetR/AcrR family transcriptional regulator n=1 Tax=Acetanaerobacterium sp. MSJ-12 TaxID=2841535 RepID=UPI001C0F1829|nr:TetR/AcrR family transcriptional regulator [Acetanaerobacterium sp. MSJ-12]MBU5419924.1 TetR/AcrR family transcriptional regulator [Acetanaerobacterium sp. MSJ-12]
MTVTEVPRDQKRARIEAAATALFLQKGVAQTSVGEIARAASVAKGTFYLYFKDKQALVDKVVAEKGGETLCRAVERTRQAGCVDRPAAAARFCECLIDFYAENPPILRFIVRGGPGAELHHRELLAPLEELLALPGESAEQSRNRLMVMLDFLVTACYRSIIEGQPAAIEVIKPLLLQTVAGIYR